MKKTRIKAKTQTHIVADEDIELVPEFADACYICADEGGDTDMLVCDNCDYKIAHLRCLNFTKVPSGTWNCMMCELQLGDIQEQLQ